jgi:pimeloyl-ACP methyl ester carboxylesterase
MNAYRGTVSHARVALAGRGVSARNTQQPWIPGQVAGALPTLSERPALLVWPTRDVAFRTPERQRWEKTFRNHRTVLLHGAGHYMQEDASHEIISAIRDFVGTSGL